MLLRPPGLPRVPAGSGRKIARSFPTARDTGAAMDFDALIIGTGQAGPALAARLAAEGMKVAVVERDKFGGTCVNNGCTRTKTTVASAYAACLASRGREYGFQIGIN